jgi:hypothetical protein
MWLSAKIVSILMAVAAVTLLEPAAAQAPPAQSGGQSASVDDPPVKHVKLTEKHIKSFIGAEKEMGDVAKKHGVKPTDAPDPKIQAELESVAKKHGFANFADYYDVASNIWMVMGGVDPQTNQPIDAIASINKEIAEIKADTSIPENEKKQILTELGEALDNARLVTKHKAAIEQVLQ